MTIGQDHCFSTFLSKFGLVIGVVCWGISHLSSLYTAAWSPPDFVCLLSLCKHSFTSLSGSAMEKHVHVAFLIQLHFSCRCSFSAFYTDFMYLKIASHSMTTKTTSYHNSKISEQRRPKPIVCPQFRYFRALFSLLHR